MNGVASSTLSVIRTELQLCTRLAMQVGGGGGGHTPGHHIDGMGRPTGQARLNPVWGWGESGRGDGGDGGRERWRGP